MEKSWSRSKSVCPASPWCAFLRLHKSLGSHCQYCQPSKISCPSPLTGHTQTQTDTHTHTHTQTHTPNRHRPVTKTGPAVCFSPLRVKGSGWGGMLRNQAKPSIQSYSGGGVGGGASSSYNSFSLCPFLDSSSPHRSPSLQRPSVSARQ